MSCAIDLLNNLDLASEDFEFPLWECGEENAIVGAMRVSGFTSKLGVGLVFERLEYSLKEGFIQCLAFCIATFPVGDWIQGVNSVQVNVRYQEDKEFTIGFGEFQVNSRGQIFTVPLEREELISGGYLDSQAQAPTPEALLFKICDTIPKNWLFGESSDLKEIFGMDDTAERLFFTEEWEHPSFDEIYGDEQMKPSTSRDLVTMAEALCSRNPSPKFSDTSNTSWRVQCTKSR
jgi:hypothetical protein